MKKLFGYDDDDVELIPNENDNSDYIHNIIYYECCRYQILGDDFFIETDITDGYCWCEFVQDEFVGKIIINKEVSFTCPNCGT